MSLRGGTFKCLNFVDIFLKANPFQSYDVTEHDIFIGAILKV